MRIPEAQKLIEELMKFELNASQAKLYYAMTKMGPAKAEDIWETAEVGHQDIYRVLKELESIGLVERIVSAPNKYRALSMTEGTSVLLSRQQLKTKELEAVAKELQAIHRCQSREESESQYELIIIPRRETFVLRVNQTFGRTLKTAKVCSTFRRLSLSLHEFTYLEALRRGVNIRVIVASLERDKLDKLENFPKFQNFELRWLKRTPVGAFSVFDEKEAYMGMQTEGGLLESRHMWTNDKALVEMASDYFELMWHQAIPLTKTRGLNKPGRGHRKREVTVNL